MKIVLVGAPGSGKSALAKALAKKLTGGTYIVDRYVEKLGKETDEEYSIYGTYGNNLQAAAYRMTAEKIGAKKNPDHLIVCGHVVESLVYNGLRTNRDLFKHKDDPELQKILLSLGEGASMGLGVIATTMLDPLELILYLPLTDATKEEYGKSYEVAVDKMIPEALQSLNRPFIAVEGDTKQKAKDAIIITDEYQDYLDRQAEGSTVAEGQGNGEGGGSDQGKQTDDQPLPDVQEPIA